MMEQNLQSAFDNTYIIYNHHEYRENKQLYLHYYMMLFRDK
jgi:hypothetical protein